MTGTAHRGAPGAPTPSGGPSRPSHRLNLEEAGSTLSEILRVANPVTRARRLAGFLDQVAPDQFQALVERFRADGLSGNRGSDYALILGAWVECAPETAAAYLLAHEEDGKAREVAIAAWAARDPRAALEWIRDKDDGGRVNNWYVGALEGVASTDPDLARTLLESLAHSDTRRRSIEAVVPHVFGEGFDYSTSWVAGIGDPSLQAEAARRLSRPLARLDPGRAGQWVSAMDNPRARRDSSEEVSDEWARVDLEAAREWVESLPPDTITVGSEGVIRHMARHDPGRAVEWINSLGISPGENDDFDGTRRILLGELQHIDPQLALENVYLLEGAQDQERSYHQILQRWMRNDDESAQSWLASNSDLLPPSLAQRYLRRNDRP